MEVNKQYDFLAGEVLAFDKDLDWTAFQLVAKVRWMLSRKLGVKRLKVGHAGTLDPKATGVELLCTGKATKRIEALQQCTKEYVAELTLGATTPSFDLELPVDATYPTAHITRELVEKTIPQFVGEIDQVPPVFSACKIEGKRAYDLARKGKDVALQAKRIRIDEIEILGFEPPLLTLRVVCGKGTYIRSLARDLGEALGSGAHLTGLRRTRVGDYEVQNCFSLEQFAQWLETASIALPTADLSGQTKSNATKK